MNAPRAYAFVTDAPVNACDISDAAASDASLRERTLTPRGIGVPVQNVNRWTTPACVNAPAISVAKLSASLSPETYTMAISGAPAAGFSPAVSFWRCSSLTDLPRVFASSSLVARKAVAVCSCNSWSSLHFSPYLLPGAELDDFFGAADRLCRRRECPGRRVCVRADFFRVCVALSRAPGVDFPNRGRSGPLGGTTKSKLNYPKPNLKMRLAASFQSP